MGAPINPAVTNPQDAHDLNSFLHAVLTRDMVSHKNAHVTGRLDWCRTVAKRAPTDCDLEEFEKKLGKAGLTVIPRKIDDLNSWMVDLIVRAFDDLFRIEPTARPDLSDEVKEKAVDAVLATVTEIVEQRAMMAAQQVMADYAQIGVTITPEQALAMAEESGAQLRPTEEELRDIVKEARSVTRQYETEEAAKGAKELSVLVKDFLQQTESLKHIMDFLHDFCVYPFAVLHSGQTRTAKIRRWKKNKLTSERMDLPAMRRVSPYDFFWTQDSTDTQNGMGVAERMAMRRFDVEQMKHIKQGAMKYRVDEIDKLLKDFETSHRNWMVEDERPHEQYMAWSLSPSETVDVFRMFVTISGVYLEPYKKELDEKIEPYRQYELEAYVCNKYILGFRLHEADHERPYYKESYEAIPSEFCGNSLPETLAVINAAARKGFIHLIRNMGKSTNPSVFVNREMVDYDVLEEEEVVLPDNQYDFMATLGSTGKPVDLLQFPNYTGEILRFQEYLDTRADIESGIPKYALGQAAGLPSALRSTAALTLMIDNALKTVKSRVFRIGTNVIAPSVSRTVDWIMNNWDDESVKVDAEVFVRGLEGVITKSLVINKIQEMLQYLSPFVASGNVKQETIDALINKFLLESGMEAQEFHNSQSELLNTASELGSPVNTLS